MIRIAAVGDIHVGEDSAGSVRPHFEQLARRADVLLLAGDLTKRGLPAEAAVGRGRPAGAGPPRRFPAGARRPRYRQDRATGGGGRGPG